MESAVKLASLYTANPLLVVRDLNSMFGSEFGKVFQFRLRESSLIYGPSQIEGYWTVSGEPDQDLDLLTEPQSRYVRRLDHIRRALLLVTRSHPEIFAVLDLQLLERFLAACRSLQTERPMSETCGVLSNADLRENLRNFAEWIDHKGLGSKDARKSSNHKDGSESDAILTAPDTELVNNSANPERLRIENKTKTHSLPAIATKPRLNALMVDLLQKHSEEQCVGWSAEEWAVRLISIWGSKPSKSSIAETRTWKWLMKLRADTGASLRAHQTVKDTHGKRRSTAH
jgi:hypothetical protein